VLATANQESTDDARVETDVVFVEEAVTFSWLRVGDGSVRSGTL
jgi:hypothetical protein